MTALRLVVIALVTAACNNDTPSPSRTDRAADLPPQPPVSLLDGTRPLHMGNCPSGVAGAMTTLGTSETGVDVVITADDPTARAAIVSRARNSAARQEPTSLKLPYGIIVHSGMHTGRGIDGFCPVMHAGTTVTVDEIPSGVIVHMQPRDKNALPALRDAVRARVQAIAPSS